MNNNDKQSVSNKKEINNKNEDVSLEAITQEESKPLSSKILIILMVAILFVPGVAKIFNINTPNYSKEPLTRMPEWTSLSLAKFPERFDNWWQDNFPTRTILLSSYNGLLDQAFHTSANDNVLVAKDDWYYYAETIRQSQNAHDLSEKDISRIVNTFSIIKTQLESEGMEFQVFIIPNKATIYPEYLPGRFDQVNEENRLEQFYEELEWAPNMLEILNEQKSNEEYLIYYEEDSHWNRLGAYAGYETIVESFDSNDQTRNYGAIQVQDGWESDLTNMLYPSIQINDEQLVYADYTQEYVSLRPMQSFEDIDIRTQSNQANETSILMFRDSFSNHLIDFLSNHYQSARYSRAFPYQFDFAQNTVDYSYVGVQLVERNLDYLIQRTPVLTVDPLGQTEFLSLAKADNNLTLSDFTATVAAGKLFLNGSYVDQSLGQEIEEVYIKIENEIYPAFAIYDDGETTDKNWEYGFSIYLDADSLSVDSESELSEGLIEQVYYRIGTEWYMGNVEILK